MNAGFPERLDFLMALTRTTNSALARELSFDASYICRIRNGKRGVPQRQPFLEPVASYLAKRIGKPYQIQAVERELGMLPGSWPDSDKATPLLVSWLSDGATPSARARSPEQEGAASRWALDQLPNVPLDHAREKVWTRAPHASPDAAVSSQSPEDSEAGRFVGTGAESASAFGELFFTNIHYGVGYAGKRAVVEAFLARLVNDGAAHRLILHSDERLDWIMGDEAFERRWIDLTEQLLRNGSSITIVHTVTRYIDDMLDATRRWLPLYLVGNVESYYCARVRDRMTRRTLFVAEGALAVTSGSIGEDDVYAVSVLHSDEATVASFTREAYALLELCRPLVSRVDLVDAAEAKRAVDMIVGDAQSLIVAYNLDDDRRFQRFGDVLPEPVGSYLEDLLVDAPTYASAHVPKDTAIIMNDRDGMLLVHVADSPVVLVANERLMVAALREFLGFN